MNKFLIKRVILFILIFTWAFEASASETRVFGLPVYQNNVTANEVARITQERFLFGNGDYFWMSRHEPANTLETPYYTSFDIPGDEIEIRYVDYVDGVKKWIVTNEPDNIKSATLFISTDKFHLVLGVPAVYLKQDGYDTMTVVKELETPVKITKGNDYYNIKALFPQDEKYIGEIWCLQSAYRLIEWDERTEALFMLHELADGRRLSLEGYYFQTPGRYVPSGEGVLFKHPSSYTGGSLARYSQSNAEAELGYVIMKLSAANQNELGFYPVPCTSLWLKEDFGIGAYYYDTRWNSDFAGNLLDAYKAYGDTEFRERAIKYSEFFIKYAEEHSYNTNRGILVQDYWHDNEFKPTHSSLNHHLAELNVILMLYDATKDERFLETAEKMLWGIEDTVYDWILPDGNLAYALYYDGTANVMVDYPYLTYNDLFTTRNLLKSILGKESSAIQTLMNSKLTWMVQNGITGYWE